VLDRGRVVTDGAKEKIPRDWPFCGP
jgi:hypothetical protein